MTLVVTGATGRFGRLVVDALLDRGVPASDIVATGRATDRLAELTERGVDVRHADYEDPASLGAAFAGATRVLLVSGDQPGARVEQHRNAVAAAADAGVELLAYTSIANAGTSTIALAADHQATETFVRESGLRYSLLRNGWYVENYTAQLPVYVEHGVVLGSAGEGRLSGATRADLAEAAAAVLTAVEPAEVYELGGEPFSYPELAAAVAAATGREVVYRDLPIDDYAQVLVGAGLPEAYAQAIADADLGIARGELLVDGDDLSRLLGRPTTPLAVAVNAEAVAASV